MIEIWGRKNAYNVQKVLWALHELNINYRHHDVGSNPGDLETSEFLAMNLHARIPVISDAGVFIWESNTIIRYLFSQYGDDAPVSPLERTYAERWMDWELSKLQPDFIDLFWGYYRMPEDSHDNRQIQDSKVRCEAHFQILNEHLRHHPFLAGSKFSFGDIPCATCLYRYFNMGLPVEKPEYVMDWYERLTNRKPYQECIMLPFNELKGRTSF